MAEPAQPVLDASRYRQLAIELKSNDDAMRFIADYWHMLPERVSRILAVLRDGDAAAAMDAVLSLKVTSSMTGALQVEHDCLRLEQDLRDGAQTDLLEASVRLALDVPPLQAALQELFRPRGAAPAQPQSASSES